MFCKVCGRKIDDDSEFCTYCGASVEPENVIYENDGETQKIGKMRVVLISVTAVLLMLSAVVFGVRIFLKNRMPEVQTEELTVGEQMEKLQKEKQEKKRPVITDVPVPTEPVYPVISDTSVKTISATSSLSEYDMTHSPERVMDGSLSTAWVEGKTGNGEGEFITFVFDKTYKVSGVQIYAGYQKNEDLYEKNTRPAKIELEFSNGKKQIFLLEDITGMQTLQFPEAVDATSISVKILSVYSGWKYTDMAISEISFY